MTRVCILGDSHIGPLYAAFSACGFLGAYRPTFFAIRTGLAQGFTLSGRILAAGSAELETELGNTSGGLNQIDIDKYDEFVIIGLGFWMGSILYNYHGFASDGMPGSAGARYILSDACYMAVCKDIVSRCEALRIAGMIRSLCSKPVTVVCAPNPGLGLTEEQIVKWYPPTWGIVRNGDDMAIAALFRDVCLNIANEHAVRIVPPLPEVAANGIFNRHEYCQLHTAPDTDPGFDRMNAMVHANDLYGVHLARHIFAEGRIVRS